MIEHPFLLVLLLMAGGAALCIWMPRLSGGNIANRVIGVFALVISVLYAIATGVVIGLALLLPEKASQKVRLDFVGQITPTLWWLWVVLVPLIGILGGIQMIRLRRAGLYLFLGAVMLAAAGWELF